MIAFLFLLASASECDNGADSEMAACWSQAYARADTELNKIWPEALKSAKEADTAFSPTQRLAHPSAEPDLLASQRAWLKYRDTQCAVEADYAQGGSLQGIIASECSTELTRERVKKLQDIAAAFREG